MQRENHYDFAGWPESNRFFGDWEEKEPAFFALISNDYAISFVIVEKTTKYGMWDGQKNKTVHFAVGNERLKISMVWTAHLLRRLDVATTLIREVATEYKTTTGDIVWGVPFSESGKALAFSLTKESNVFVG